MSRGFSILIVNAREAADSLKKARLRTILALIGVMIGISSVIAMVSLGEIAKEEARKNFESLGTDILIIRKDYRSQGAEISLENALQLLANVGSLVESAPRILAHGRFVFAGQEVGQGSVQGVTRSFASINQLSVQEGRFISDLDIARYYCVVGAGIAQQMRAADPGPVVGEILEIDGALYTIVGVLDPKEENYALPTQVDADRSVFIPITSAQRIAPDPGIEVIIARSQEGAHNETVVEDVRSFFASRTPNLSLDIITAKELIAQMEEQMGIFGLLLASVGSISLVVGGIGIMNIMLVSVTERRREIAIRRALGARQGDIRSQFLIESIILTTVGGLLGILLGLLATWGITFFTGWDFLISGISVTSGIGTALAVGLFFGFQPAHQASRMDPVAGL